MAEIIGKGRTAELSAWGEGKVLKLYYDFMPTWLVDREFHNTQAAHLAGLCVPFPYERVSREAREGIVFERINGRTMMYTFMRRPWMLSRLFQQMAEIQVVCQQTQASGLLRVKDSLEHQIRQGEAFGLTAMQVSRVLIHLRQLPDADYFCHMDFHPDNLMIGSKGPVIIDWMNATAGFPLADTARTWLMLNMSSAPGGPAENPVLSYVRKVACRNYMLRYQQLHPFSQAELDAWMLPVAAARLAENIPGEQGHLLEKVERLLLRIGVA